MEFDAKDKYKKVIRYHKKLEKLQTNNGNKISNTDSRDLVEDFFNHCYHLKDWLKKDKKILLMNDVEDFINNCKYLSLAADYCNTFKHSGLDSKTRSNKTIDKINTHINFDLNPSGFVASSRLEITIEGEKYDALGLAEECIKEWNSFLEKNEINFNHE